MSYCSVRYVFLRVTVKRDQHALFCSHHGYWHRVVIACAHCCNISTPLNELFRIALYWHATSLVLAQFQHVICTCLSSACHHPSVWHLMQSDCFTTFCIYHFYLPSYYYLLIESYIFYALFLISHLLY